MMSSRPWQPRETSLRQGALGPMGECSLGREWGAGPRRQAQWGAAVVSVLPLEAGEQPLLLAPQACSPVCCRLDPCTVEGEGPWPRSGLEEGGWGLEVGVGAQGLEQ